MPYLILLLVALLAGCGQKGPLFLPGETPAAPVPGAGVTPEETAPEADATDSVEETKSAEPAPQPE
jgi:predicted small lipoprotein YifL